MKKFWYKIETDKDIDLWNREFGSNAFVEIDEDEFYSVRSKHFEKIQAGEWWSDKIKKLRDKPHERLQLAIENLPCPAAFRECAIALRALIREKRKQKLELSVQLRMLYQIAAIESLSIPYSEALKEPGFNVMDSIPGGLIFKLPVSYDKLGYKRLELLNKTDAKWMIELWGEPEIHSTFNKLHNKIWAQYENRLLSKRKEESEKFINTFKSLVGRG